MSNNTYLENLNQISATLSERDKKIYENVAHSISIAKETEKLRNEIARLEKHIKQRKEENKMMEEQIVQLDKTVNIEQETLRISQRSLAMQKVARESLQQEAIEWKKKYEEALKMFDEEIQEQREMYESRSKGYQELKALRIELKKLEIEKMAWEVKVHDLEAIEAQYRDIQERRLQAAIVRFAECYVVYHERQRLQEEVQKKKKEEEELMRQHLQLAALVKEKKKLEQLKAKNRNQGRREQVISTKSESTQQTKKLTEEKLQKFLEEEFLPCSLTSFDTRNKIPDFNKDCSKVKILDAQIIKQVEPFRPKAKKSNPELEKEMENYMKETRKQVLKSNSFQVSHVEFISSQEKKKQKVIATSVGSQENQNRDNIPQSASRSSQSKQNKAKQVVKTDSGPVGTQKTSEPPKSIFQPSGSVEPELVSTRRIPINLTFRGAQPSEPKQFITNPNFGEPPNIFGPQQTNKQSGLTEATKQIPINPRETLTKMVTSSQTSRVQNSILKPSSQPESKQENVSKFFPVKKKTVTFQSGDKKEGGHNIFSLFGREEQAESATGAKELNFLSFAKGASWQETKLAEGGTASSTMETDTFGTYGTGESIIDRRNAMTINFGDTSFNQNIISPPDTNFGQAVEGACLFNFSKPNNPWDFGQ